MIATADLKLHEACHLTPSLTPQEYKGLELSIMEDGVLAPLQVNGRLEVLDGRHRLKVAKSLRMLEVPCVVLEGADEALVVEMLVSGRRLSKGAACYYALRIGLRDWMMHANERKALSQIPAGSSGPALSAGPENIDRNAVYAGMKDPAKFQVTQYGFDGDNQETMATRLGVGVRLLEQCIELSKLVDKMEGRTFTDPKTETTRTWEKEIDHDLRVKGKGVGSCLSKIKNWIAHSPDSETSRSARLEKRAMPWLQFQKHLNGCSSHLAKYEKLEAPEKEKMQATATEQVMKWPKDIQIAVRNALVQAQISKDA
jgi:hypothetical protein